MCKSAASATAVLLCNQAVGGFIADDVLLARAGLQDGTEAWDCPPVLNKGCGNWAWLSIGIRGFSVWRSLEDLHAYAWKVLCVHTGL